MKTIVISTLPKKDGERKEKMFLADIDAEGNITKLTFREWEDIHEPDEASEYLKDCFIVSLIRQVDRFTLRIDYNRWVMDNRHEVSFTQKVAWLLNKGGCLYTKRGLTN